MESVWGGEQTLIAVERKNAEGKTEKIAEGYEVEIKPTAVVYGQEVSWSERHLFVHSFRHAQASETALQKRLENATQAFQALNERKPGKKRLNDKVALEQEVARLPRQHQVNGLLEVQVTEEVHE